MKKQIIATTLSLAIGFSSSILAFANIADSGVQNKNGLPENATQLGSFESTGFVYSEDPFKNMNAPDKGLIPYSQENNYNNPSFWAIDEVLEASKMNLNNMEIITGYQKDITRREFCSLIMQAYYKYSKVITPLRTVPANAPHDIFTDVDPVADSDIFDAYYLDITYGVGNKHFNPNSKITREQIAVMLYRFIEIFDQSITYDYDVNNYFADDNQISGWAKKEVRTMSNREIIKGVGHNLFDPKSNTTKEQSLLLDLRVCKTFLDPQVKNDLETPDAPILNVTKLMWDAVKEAQNYNVYKYEWKSGTEYTKTFVNRTNTTSLDIKGLESGTYEFSIQAFNEFYMSEESQKILVYVPEAINENSIDFDFGFAGETTDITWNHSFYKELDTWANRNGSNTNNKIKYKVVVENKDTNEEVMNIETVYADNEVTTPDLAEGNYQVTIYAIWEDQGGKFISAGATKDFEIEEQPQ